MRKSDEAISFNSQYSLERCGTTFSIICAESVENMVPKTEGRSRQKFFVLAHKSFRNGAKIILKWREFFRRFMLAENRNVSEALR